MKPDIFWFSVMSPIVELFDWEPSKNSEIFKIKLWRCQRIDDVYIHLIHSIHSLISLRKFYMFDFVILRKFRIFK